MKVFDADPKLAKPEHKALAEEVARLWKSGNA